MSISLQAEAQKEKARVGRDLRRTHPTHIHVKRTGVTLCPDPARVLIRPFNFFGERRAANICARVAALPEAEVNTLLEQVLSEFAGRHQEIKQILQTRFQEMRHYLLTDQPLSQERQ